MKNRFILMDGWIMAEWKKTTTVAISPNTGRRSVDGLCEPSVSVRPKESAAQQYIVFNNTLAIPEIGVSR